MSQKSKRIVRKLRSLFPVMNGTANVTFSQYGEDIIMLKMLERYNVTNISYLDIGANDPVNGSNTYGFYLRGYRGVLVEPNAHLCNEIKKRRPDDKCLNVGISNANINEADYYMFSADNSAMNTFSKTEADYYETCGFKLAKTVKMQLVEINEIIEKNFKETPTLISLDVEGLDEAILQKLDCVKHPILLICVESVDYTPRKEFKKRKSIIDLMISKGYFVYADTNANTIFCNREHFDRILAIIDAKS